MQLTRAIAAELADSAGGRMQLTLESKEVEVLKRVLSQFLSDLRMEVRDTENYDMRQDLKDDEDVLKSIIARLGQ
jgi:hypothetical protein